MSGQNSADSSSHSVGTEKLDLLLHGRACYEREEWNDAFAALSLADRSTSLGTDDLVFDSKVFGARSRPCRDRYILRNRH
jgi:hypothetical protein